MNIPTIQRRQAGVVEERTGANRRQLKVLKLDYGDYGPATFTFRCLKVQWLVVYRQGLPTSRVKIWEIRTETKSQYCQDHDRHASCVAFLTMVDRILFDSVVASHFKAFQRSQTICLSSGRNDFWYSPNLPNDSIWFNLTIVTHSD